MQPSSLLGEAFVSSATSAPPVRRAHYARHSPWIIALHWFSVLAMVVATAAILARELVEIQSLRIALMEMHRQSGLLVLLALGLRLAVRFKTGMADHAGDMPKIMQWAAQMAHLALYAMLLALPLLGWAVCSAHGTPIKLLGLIPLPDLVGADSDLADTLTDYHVWAAWGMLALVVAHAGAAWWHHAIRRDGVLVAMLPAAGQKG